jgi:hypothetical protein
VMLAGKKSRFVGSAVSSTGASRMATAKSRALRPSDQQQVRRIVAYVPTDLWRAFKLRCVAEDRTMSDVVTETVGAWLKKRT